MKGVHKTVFPSFGRRLLNLFPKTTSGQYCVDDVRQAIYEMDERMKNATAMLHFFENVRNELGAMNASSGGS